MTTRTLNTSPAPDVRITQIDGNLTIKGWANTQVMIETSPDDLRLDEQSDQISLSCSGNCEIRLPAGAALQVETVHGNASIKLLEEPLSIGTVHGALMLRNVAGAAIGTVHGQLSARRIEGDLQARQVNGHADIRQVEGSCHLDQVDGHLDLQDVTGSLLAQVSGNARLRLGQMTGSDYRVEADGSIQCTIPDDACLKLDLTSEAERIQVQLPAEKRSLRQETWQSQTGEGEPQAALILRAEGSIQLMAQRPDWNQPGGEAGQPQFDADFSEQISRQVEAQISLQMAEMTARLTQQMDELRGTLERSGISPDETERIVAQAMRTRDAETARAEEKVRRAQEKLERKLEVAQRKAEAKAQAAERRQHGRHSWGFSWPTPPAPPTPPSPPRPPAPPAPPAGASEEERLMILRMLEQKKISLEDADRLLSALEGKE